jgi:integrase
LAIRRRGSRWAVEIYDGTRKSRKRYVGTYDSQREARDAEREAEQAIARRRGRPASEETVASFAERWLDLRPRQKASTNQAYREQVKPFVAVYGERRLAEVDIELAYAWLGDKRWTHGGVRAMFSDARRLGLVDSNPFAGLRLRGSRGRKDVAPLRVEEVHQLADCAVEVWTGEVALTVRALILTAAFVGVRPGEMYGLRWSDLDFRESEVRVDRQYSTASRDFELPKNGRRRVVVLASPAREALLALPRPVDSEALIFRGRRGGPLNGRTQHYYWHPVRCRFGNPSLDFYELRHFCGAWLFNDLELPAQDVAHQLGHTDGGALVQSLYGHPSERLARERIKRAVGGTAPRLVAISEARRRQAGP